MSLKIENCRSPSTNKKRALKGGNFRITTKTSSDQGKEKMALRIGAEPLVSADNMFEAKNPRIPENRNNLLHVHNAQSQASKLDHLVNQIGSINSVQYKLDQELVNRYNTFSAHVPMSANQEATKAALADFLQVRQVNIKGQDGGKKIKTLTPKQGSSEERVERSKKQKNKDKKSLASSADQEHIKSGEEEVLFRRNSIDLAPVKEVDSANKTSSKLSGRKESKRKESGKDSLPSLKDIDSGSGSAHKKRRSGSETPNQDNNKNPSFDLALQKSDRRHTSSLTPKKERAVNAAKTDALGARFGPLEKIKEINAKKSPVGAALPIAQKSINQPVKPSQMTMSNNSIFTNKSKTLMISNFPATNNGTNAKIAQNTSLSGYNVKPKMNGATNNENIDNPNNRTTPTPRGGEIGARSGSLGNSAVVSVKFSPNQSIPNKSQAFPQQNRMVKPFNSNGFATQQQAPSVNNPIINAMLNPNQIANQGQGLSFLANASAINLRQPIPVKIEEPKKKAVYVPPPVSNKLKYALGGGNNVQLVKRVLSKRDWWEETETFNTLFNLKWQQTYRGYKYDRLVEKSGSKQLVNHFEYHTEISTKDGLIRNLINYCEANKIMMFDCTPLTFMFDMDDEAHFDRDMQKFAKVFIKNHPDQSRYAHPNPADRKFGNVWYNFDYRKKGNYLHPNLNDEKKTSPYLKPIMANTFVKTANAWVLKPVGFNRGRGIEVFNTLEALNEFINDWYMGNKKKKEIAAKKEEVVGSDGEEEEEDALTKELTVTSRSFVIQKYIEDPMLIHKRKFDFRVWVLVTHDMQLYFFKEGYLRMSSEEFSLAEDKVCNKFIHLTNNAVQKYSNGYGQHESGNQLSFDDFENYMAQNNLGGDFRGKILPRMKELVKYSMQSVGKILNQHDRKSCFEVFGYDFMIDAEFNTWLIEVNTNPCIEESSPLLGMLIPRMIDDAFKMTVDVVFPKPYRKQNTQAQRGNATEEKKVKPELSSPAPHLKLLNNENVKTPREASSEKQEEEKTSGDVEQRVEGESQPNQAKEEAKPFAEEGEVKVEKEVIVNEEKPENKFTSPTKTVKIEEPTTAAPESSFSVKGYTDAENMWEFICALQTGPKSPVKRDKKF